jgi:D-glycero-D-manno-heptose 1,7-bisphosphate phosphatase
LLTSAIFLDRDGVINKHRSDYVKSIGEFELLPRVAHYLRQLQKLGFKLVIVTNQSAVNRGLISLDQLKVIHNFLVKELSRHECYIADIFYCPHTPDENCECRKPNIKMFLDAARKHSIDLTRSWVIGDNDTDIEPGRKIGCNTIKIQTNASLRHAYYKIRDETMKKREK